MVPLRRKRAFAGALVPVSCAFFLGLAACGDSPDPAASATPAAGGAAKAAPAKGGAADMVNAVTLSGPDAPVNLQFALRSKPKLNEPLEMGFVLQPTRDIDSAQVTFEQNDQLDITSENPFFSIAHTAAGAGAGTVYKLTVLPKRVGVLSMTAIVSVDLPTGAVARTFAIPIIVFADKH